MHFRELFLQIKWGVSLSALMQICWSRNTTVPSVICCYAKPFLARANFSTWNIHSEKVEEKAPLVLQHRRSSIHCASSWMSSPLQCKAILLCSHLRGKHAAILKQYPALKVLTCYKTYLQVISWVVRWVFSVRNWCGSSCSNDLTLALVRWIMLKIEE